MTETVARLQAIQQRVKGEDQFHGCADCDFVWRGTAVCWFCGGEGEVAKQPTYFSGASWRVDELDRVMAEDGTR